MESYPIDALVAGHLCLDIIPTFLTGGQSLGELFVPGKLIDVADAVLGTGGAASNTGLALHRLGFRTGIVGKIGDDHFGDIIVKILRQHGDHLADAMIVGRGEATSYSIVINPPGVDRIFLHNAGVNNTFAAGEVTDEALRNARLIHFGYPPLMRKFYQNNGDELRQLFERAHRFGLATSLDMSRPDPDGEAGKLDWNHYLENVLPHVDAFLPSIDEILFMTDRPLFDQLVAAAGDGNPASGLRIDQVRSLADKLLAMGPAMIGFKLGDEGFYLRATGDKKRLAALGRVAPEQAEDWLDKEFVAGCRRVEVKGTTGAGDCTIAGFLGGLLRGRTADEAAAMAVCVGGASVEARDSTSGVPPWDKVRERLAAGWPTRPCRLAPKGWEQTALGNWHRA